MLRISERLSIPMDEFTFEFARSGGPGGQNVNKVNSKALLRWAPGRSPSLTEPVRARLMAKLGSKLTGEGEWLVTSQKTRDQSRNVDDCLEKVRLVVLAALTPPTPRRATKPTMASQTRRVDDKVRRSETKKLRRGPASE
jgi:ribosome-associated protein